MYCKGCGNEVRSSSKFCSKCGEKLEDVKMEVDSVSEKKTKKKKEVVEAEVVVEKDTYDNRHLIYCRHCGQEIPNGSIICPICRYHLVDKQSETSVVESIMICLFAFFIPLVGFILWAIFKDENSSKAKRALIAALVGIFAYLVLVVLVIMFFMFIFSLGGI